MERLEIKKVYIDSRFKTAESKGDTDFIVELPKTFNVPEDVVCYINDIAIPVSWSTISSRNNKLYFSVDADDVIHWFKIEMDDQNYNGQSFSVALQTKLNDKVVGFFEPDKLSFQVTYDVVDNMVVIDFQDKRVFRYTTMEVKFYSDKDVTAGVWNNTAIRMPESIADNIRLTTTFAMSTASQSQSRPENGYNCYLNLHAIRNLYLHSSALSNYDTVTNFGMGTIVKKIPIRANYNEMIFDNGSDGFDYCVVSKRTLSRLDFRLTDAYGSLIDLRNNHFSFSLVFQRTN